MDEWFNQLGVSKELAFKFTMVFSRMEYALKSTSYIKCKRQGVEANWDKFANKIHDDFQKLDDCELIDAVAYLKKYPPKKQICNEQKLEFVDRSPDGNQKETQQILLMIRTVRNNLFHGGKFVQTEGSPSGRNEKLVEVSLIILERCKVLDDEVKSSFER